MAREAVDSTNSSNSTSGGRIDNGPETLTELLNGNESLVQESEPRNSVFASFALSQKASALRLNNDQHGDPLVQTASVPHFTLESGSVLEQPRIGYTVYATNLKSGEAPGDREVVLLYPALTGTSRFKLSNSKNGSQGDGWGSEWAGSDNPELGESYFLNTDRFTVVALDHFGGRKTNGAGYGLSSAVELGPLAKEVSLRDGVRLTCKILPEELGIDSVKAVIGGSMGGGQAFEYLFQDAVKVGHIFDISGCGALDAKAKDFFEFQEGFLREGRKISHEVSGLVKSNLPSERRTEGFIEAIEHVVNRLREFEDGNQRYSDNIEASKLFAVRQFGFLLFVTPEFFEEKRLSFEQEKRKPLEEKSGARTKDESISDWLDRHGDSFAHRFDSEGLANLCGMIAKSPPLEAAKIVERLLELNSTKVLRLSTQGDTLFPFEQQREFNAQIVGALAGRELFSEQYPLSYRNGHDHFFSREFRDMDVPFLKLKLEA